MPKNSLKKKPKVTDLNEFITIIEQNSFEMDLQKMAADFAFRFGYKGPVMEAELSSEKLISFFDDYKETFDKLAYEHIKKFDQIKSKIDNSA